MVFFERKNDRLPASCRASAKFWCILSSSWGISRYFIFDSCEERRMRLGICTRVGILTAAIASSAWAAVNDNVGQLAVDPSFSGGTGANDQIVTQPGAIDLF